MLIPAYGGSLVAGFRGILFPTGRELSLPLNAVVLRSFLEFKSAAN